MSIIMLDWNEYEGLNWADTVKLMEKKGLNVASEVAYIIHTYCSREFLPAEYEEIMLATPSLHKYRKDIEKYMLLM